MTECIGKILETICPSFRPLAHSFHESTSKLQNHRRIAKQPRYSYVIQPKETHICSHIFAHVHKSTYTVFQRKTVPEAPMGRGYHMSYFLQCAGLHQGTLSTRVSTKCDRQLPLTSDHTPKGTVISLEFLPDKGAAGRW